VVLRCVIDGLLLPAQWHGHNSALVLHDGDESFRLEAVEAACYELVNATDSERLLIQRAYRLMRTAVDYRRAVA
jgi:hypothetical protein